MSYFKPHKYHAKRTAVDGVSFPSKAEARRYLELLLLLRGKCINGFCRQVPFMLGCPENIYRVDFLVFYSDSVQAEDVKGMETPTFKKNKRLWAKYGPCSLKLLKASGTKWKTETITPSVEVE